MDTKIGVVSGVLALLMVSSGFMLMIDDSSNDEDTQNLEQQQDSTPTENEPPQLFNSEQYTHSWDNENASIEGFILDEESSTVTVNVIILDSNTLQEIGGVRSISPSTDGEWSLLTEFAQPGTWLVQIQAVDSSGLSSEVSMAQLTVEAPQEEDVVLSTLWIQPEENSSIGTLQGLMLHMFPATCSIEYHPLGQSPARLIDGVVNSTTGEYSMSVDTSYHNTIGDLIASCGLFSESTSTIRLNLPVPPEPETRS